MQALNDLDRDAIREILASYGEPAYRAGQICEWLYRRRAATFEAMTNLPLGLRQRLKDGFTISRLRPTGTEVSAEDGTTKYLLELADGNRIESVLLPHPRGATLCISSQVGCALRCRFCATGRMRFKRDLSPGEIVDQVAFIEQALEKAGDLPPESTRAFSNIVLMGMGEPLANYDNMMKAVRILVAEMGIGVRRITISTSGLADKIIRLADQPYDVRLAISINSPFDATRREIMPLAGRTPLARVMSAARYYYTKKAKLVTFEYVLIADVNDRIKDAHALATLIREVPAKINLIALNPFEGCNYARPDPGRVRAFKAVLKERGKKVTLRKSLGCDILAGCGQLGARGTGSRI